MRSPLALMLEGLIRLYRLVPKTGDHCRYHPSCSAYGLQAVQVHGAVRGAWLTIRRIGRCQPWGGTGLDPVPPHRRDRVHTSPTTASFLGLCSRPTTDMSTGPSRNRVPPLGVSAAETPEEQSSWVS